MDFCKAFNIPVSQTQAGHSCLPDSFELAVGGIGVTGGLAANALCKDCDLVIGVGTRFNDFVTGSKWVLFRNPDIKVLAINTSEFHAESWMQPAASATQRLLSKRSWKAQGRRLQVRLHHRNSGYPQGLGRRASARSGRSVQGRGLRRGQVRTVRSQLDREDHERFR